MYIIRVVHILCNILAYSKNMKSNLTFFYHIIYVSCFATDRKNICAHISYRINKWAFKMSAYSFTTPSTIFVELFFSMPQAQGRCRRL